MGFQPKPGWTRTQSGRVVTWSGGEIGPGEFDEFGMSIHVPANPGTELVFPATQTYANGKVVRLDRSCFVRLPGTARDHRAREGRAGSDHDGDV